MNHARFLQVADRYQIRMFDEWTRNRVVKDIDEMFHDWYSREWVCRDLKATEAEYASYVRAIPNDPDEPSSSGMVKCPSCGDLLGLQAVKR
jgi:hypothetical protein